MTADRLDDGREILERVDLPLRTFGAWLGERRRRWLAGEKISVLVARDRTHALVVRDPHAKPPPPETDKGVGSR